MDSKGNFPSSISSMKSESRCSHRLQDVVVASAVYIPPLGSHLVRNPQQWSGDRFIPNRSAMDMDIARSLLTQPRRKENNAASSPRKQAYLKILTETLLPKGSRILAFNSNPRSTSEPSITRDVLSGNFPHKTKSSKKPERCVPESAFRILDAPGMASEYSLNLLDWGSSDVLSIALGNTVHLWYALEKSTSELVTFDEDDGPITSVSWAPDGRHLAIGLDSSEVQLWDCSSGRMLRSLKGVHQSRVGSLSWNNNILTTGDMDGLIANNDVRIRSHVVQTYQGHEDEVCGLKWSRSGKLLASGGIDNLVHIWDITMSSLTPPPTQHHWLHRLEDHTSAVKALAWCPFQTNLLASGGGVRDRCIKFWNGNTGACLNSVDTGSQVCALLWNKNERELLSSHGFTKNQLTLWKYPSMVKVQELMGHTSAALFMAQSPDGCTVASAAGDETLRFWNVFGTSKVKKPAPSEGPLTYRSHIR